MDVKQTIRESLLRALEKLQINVDDQKVIDLSVLKQKEHGDFSTNIALVVVLPQSVARILFGSFPFMPFLLKTFNFAD